MVWNAAQVSKLPHGHFEKIFYVSPENEAININQIIYIIHSDIKSCLYVGHIPRYDFLGDIKPSPRKSPIRG